MIKKGMITIKERYDKKDINTLPRVNFGGRIFTVLTAQEADKAVDYLMKAPILGIDTETRPTFRRGQAHLVALLQVSTDNTAFLFRLNHIGLPPSLIRLLEDNTITKVGLSLHDDFLMLKKRHNFTPGHFIELQHEAKELGIADMSLQKLYANLYGEKISKNQQLSNWEADVLSDAQKLYAATDAWACIKIYEKILELKHSGDYTLEKTQEPEFTSDDLLSSSLSD
jgi:ribonuclease D